MKQIITLHLSWLLQEMKLKAVYVANVRTLMYVHQPAYSNINHRCHVIKTIISLNIDLSSQSVFIKHI